MGIEQFEDSVKQEVEDRGGTDALKETRRTSRTTWLRRGA
jgi:hypothetical protein